MTWSISLLNATMVHKNNIPNTFIMAQMSDKNNA